MNQLALCESTEKILTDIIWSKKKNNNKFVLGYIWCITKSMNFKTMQNSII